jgi:hypothetical protein
MKNLLVPLFSSQLFVACAAFMLHHHHQPSRTCGNRHGASSDENSVDVSDLGVTMQDLEAPLPRDMLNMELSGYDSTSRIPGVEDDGCKWTETPHKMTCTLTIPGLRGQPSLALNVLTSKNTVSVTAFGQVVWSCILRGQVKPETAKFEANDGNDMVPVIDYEVEKSTRERWERFILQIGEDSIL